MASRLTWPGLRNVSFKRQMSTPCCLRKCSISSFLLRTPSAFQEGKCRFISHSVLPYSATNRITVFRTARCLTAPVGWEEMDLRSRRIRLTHAWRGRWSRRSEIYSSSQVELWVGNTRSGVTGFAATVLTLAASFFLGFHQPAYGLL